MDKNDITNIKVLLKFLVEEIDKKDYMEYLWLKFEHNIKGHTLDRENLDELIFKLDNL